VIGQHRSSQRYRAKQRGDEEEMVKDILRITREHPRFGTRRITALLERDGWSVNRKRVQRLRRKLGLKVPRKQHKKRRLGSSANSCTRRRAERMNQVWTYDFVFDRTEDGRRLKVLAVVDEYTRECLALEVERSFTATRVVTVLAKLVATRGAPEFVRSDNGPEFIADAVRSWLTSAEVDTAFIEPGAPWENAYIETFNGKLRDELFNRELFLTIGEAKYLAAKYRTEYNDERPHSTLDYMTPAEFAFGCAPSGSATLRLRAHTRRHQQLVRLS
jgi:putative transposase